LQLLGTCLLYLPPLAGASAICEDQAAQLVVLDSYRYEIDGIMAVQRASQSALQPVVPRPTSANPRNAAARRHNRDGCIVGGAEWKAAQAQKTVDEGAKQAKKTASERAVWENKRVDLRAAESALATADREPGQLSVKLLCALIFSRTGRTHKAKNNRDGALLSEARAALETGRTTLLPPTPPPALALDDDDAEDDRCPECLTEVDVSITPDENGMLWCEGCGHRLDESDEGDE
jgi:hypothetical protein